MEHVRHTEPRRGQHFNASIQRGQTATDIATIFGGARNLVNMLSIPNLQPDHGAIEARRDIIYYGRKLAECGFHAALAGNISARIGNDRLVCTVAGADKGDLGDEQLVICDLQGSLLEGAAPPTSELLLHLSTDRARP